MIYTYIFAQFHAEMRTIALTLHKQAILQYEYWLREHGQAGP